VNAIPARNLSRGDAESAWQALFTFPAETKPVHGRPENKPEIGSDGWSDGWLEGWPEGTAGRVGVWGLGDAGEGRDGEGLLLWAGLIG